MMTSIGDMSQFYTLRGRSAELKQSVQRLTEELSSGRVSDPGQRLGGDYGYLTDVVHSLKRLDSYEVAASEAASLTDAAQLAMGRMQDISGPLSTTLLSAANSTLPTARGQAALQAQGALEDIVSALNSTMGGRNIFSGTAPDRAPIVSSDAILTGLKAAIGAATTPADIDAAARAWFDDPAGFRATAYNGGDTAMAPIRIAPGQEIEMRIMADDPVFRDLIREVAVAALTDDPTLGYDQDTRAAILTKAGEGLLTNQDPLSGLRSDLGFAQARIEDGRTQIGAARTSLQQAETRLLEADPYTTAIQLEETRFHLESLYSVTARLSSLSLLSFMK